MRGGQEQGGPVRTDDPSSPLGRAQEDNCPPSRLPAPYDRMPETASNPLHSHHRKQSAQP